jgi:hypothetical protein
MSLTYPAPPFPGADSKQFILPIPIGSETIAKTLGANGFMPKQLTKDIEGMLWIFWHKEWNGFQFWGNDASQFSRVETLLSNRLAFMILCSLRRHSYPTEAEISWATRYLQSLEANTMDMADAVVPLSEISSELLDDIDDMIGVPSQILNRSSNVLYTEDTHDIAFVKRVMDKPFQFCVFSSNPGMYAKATTAILDATYTCITRYMANEFPVSDACREWAAAMDHNMTTTHNL